MGGGTGPFSPSLPEGGDGRGGGRVGACQTAGIPPSSGLSGHSLGSVLPRSLSSVYWQPCLRPVGRRIRPLVLCPPFRKRLISGSCEHFVKTEKKF